jgi:hypothetical protein
MREETFSPASRRGTTEVREGRKSDKLSYDRPYHQKVRGRGVKLRAEQAITRMLQKQSRQLAVATKITNQVSLEAISIKAFTPRFLKLWRRWLRSKEAALAHAADAKRAISCAAQGVVPANPSHRLNHHAPMKGHATMWPSLAVQDVAGEVMVAGSVLRYAHLETWGSAVIDGRVDQRLGSLNGPCLGACPTALTVKQGSPAQPSLGHGVPHGERLREAADDEIAVSAEAHRQ